MLLLTTSSLSRAAILPSDDLNESTAKILFSMRTSDFVRISTRRRGKRMDGWKGCFWHEAGCSCGPFREMAEKGAAQSKEASA